MNERAAYVRFEGAVASALRSPDPNAALRSLAGQAWLPSGLAPHLAQLDADGVRLSALLVARLRFERIVQGSTEAGAWFARDPAAFTDRFRSYHRNCAPTAFSSVEEARAFEAWCRARRDPA